MSGLIIAGDTSGSIAFNAPAVAGTNTITLPAGTGTVTVAGVNSNLVSGTAVATTSGTAIDFTGIPSWVTRITIILGGVAWSTSQSPRVQIGTGGVVTTTGYSGTSGGYSSAGTNVVSMGTTGFDITGNANTGAHTGDIVLMKVSIPTNTWVCSAQLGQANGARILNTGGVVALSGTLNIVRFTSVSGGTLNAGTINIIYD
jgi:hypothetical protein